MKKLLLVDLSSIFWRAWHASGDAEINKAKDVTTGTIQKASSGYRHVVLCEDQPPYSRSLIYPEYKANREEKSEQATGMFTRVKEYLDNRWPIVGCDGAEADDIIATLTRQAVESGDTKVSILTPDKDLWQLLGDNVNILSVHKRDENGDPVVYTAADCLATHGHPPEMTADRLALEGDKADNVPGVPGVGPKTAAKLIKDIGGIQEIITVLEGESDTQINPPSLHNKLFENIDNIKLSYELVKLESKLPIDLEGILGQEPEQPGKKPWGATSMPDLELEVAHDAPQTSIIQAAPAVIQREWSQTLEPDNFDNAVKLSKILYESRLYTKFPNPQSIYAVIMRGRELGYGATTSLDMFAVVQGAPRATAESIIGRVKANKRRCLWLRFTVSTDKLATCETVEADDPTGHVHSLTYTIEEAQQAGVVRSGSGWTKYPGAMLRARAGTALCRMVYPDITLGMYAREEF